MTIPLLFAALLAAVAPARAPGAAHADDLRALARTITKDAPTDYAKARAIYGWIATNISYDVASYLAGGTGDMSAEAVVARKTAVCDGYANLFIRLADEVGIEAVKVPGYAKGFDHVSGRAIDKSNHAWVSFRIGRQWHLADPTWGAGHVSSELEFEPSFTWFYFDVQPELLVLSHFPEDARLQRLRRPLSRRDFERMATVPQALRALGFPAAELQRVAADRSAAFPVGVAVDSTLRVINAPLAATLSTAQGYDFEISWTGAKDVAVVVGDVWTKLAPLGNGRFAANVRPAAGQVMVAGDTGAGWKTMLVYQAR